MIIWFYPRILICKKKYAISVKRIFTKVLFTNGLRSNTTLIFVNIVLENHLIRFCLRSINWVRLRLMSDNLNFKHLCRISSVCSKTSPRTSSCDSMLCPSAQIGCQVPCPNPRCNPPLSSWLEPRIDPGISLSSTSRFSCRPQALPSSPSCSLSLPQCQLPS